MTDFSKMSEKELIELKLFIRFMEKSDNPASALTQEQMKKALEYQIFLKQQEETTDETTTEEDTTEQPTTDREEGPEPWVSVYDILTSEVADDEVLSLVESIYLAFPGFQIRKDLPAVFPYNLSNELETAAAAAYYQYVVDLHGTTHKNYLQVKECLEAFDNSSGKYKEEELPFAFHEMEAIGIEFLKKIRWNDALWMVDPLKKKANKVLEEYLNVVI